MAKKNEQANGVTENTAAEEAASKAEEAEAENTTAEEAPQEPDKIAELEAA